MIAFPTLLTSAEQRFLTGGTSHLVCPGLPDPSRRKLFLRQTCIAALCNREGRSCPMVLRQFLHHHWPCYTPPSTRTDTRVGQMGAKTRPRGLRAQQQMTHVLAILTRFPAARAVSATRNRVPSPLICQAHFSAGTRQSESLQRQLPPPLL